jgi:protein involved in polysaccharide export with SLBB domain
MFTIRRTLLISLGTIAIGGCNTAATKPAAVVRPDTIAAGDTILVEAIGSETPYSHQLKVAENGDVRLQYFGDVHVAGLTEDQADVAVIHAADIRADPRPRFSVQRLVPLQVGDRLEIDVDDLEGPGTTTHRVVSIMPNGKIRLFLVGDVEANGLTVLQIQERILESLTNTKADSASAWRIRVRRFRSVR